jgi:WS/DGAT/MGAT family acyltransferase
MVQEFKPRMSDSDALMWTIERDPLLRSTITAVVLLDQAPDRGRLRKLLDEGTRVVPRMRHRVRGNPYSLVPPRWEVDPNFNLDFHLRWVGGGTGHSIRDVLDYAQPVAMQSFDRARPPWEVHVIEGLEGGGAALVIKIHHAITDGIGAVQMAMVLFELERDAAPAEAAPPARPEVHVLGAFERLLDGIRYEIERETTTGRRALEAFTAAASAAVSDPVKALQRGRDIATSVARLTSPATAPLSPVMSDRSLSVHFDVLSVPVEQAKRAAARAIGSLNDAFVAATTAGFRRYHEHHGAATASLRMTMPISVREEAEAMGGNRFVPARFEVPLVIDDPIRRMQTLHNLIIEQRHEPAMDLVDPLAGVLNRLPRGVATSLFGSMLKGMDLITSNVPGAPIPLYSAGAHVDAMYAFGPLSGAAASVVLLSYVDQCHIAVNTDPAAVPDPDVLLDCLRDGWEEILAVAKPKKRPRTRT